MVDSCNDTAAILLLLVTRLSFFCL